MISAWNLVWIIPAAVFIGIMMTCLLVANGDDEEDIPRPINSRQAVENLLKSFARYRGYSMEIRQDGQLTIYTFSCGDFTIDETVCWPGVDLPWVLAQAITEHVEENHSHSRK